MEDAEEEKERCFGEIDGETISNKSVAFLVGKNRQSGEGGTRGLKPQEGERSHAGKRRQASGLCRQ